MAPVVHGKRDDSSGWVAFSVRARPVPFFGALVGGVVAIFSAGFMLSEFKGGGSSPPDAGVAQVASIANGKEPPKPPKPKKKTPPESPPDDAPQPKPKEPTVRRDGGTESTEGEQMAGEPEVKTCRPGDTREQGCTP